MMYKILVTCALSQELVVVKKQIKQANVPGLKVDFLQTGIGNYNMIFSLTNFLKNKDYDFFLNIGIAGLRQKTKKNLSFAKFYQISNVFNLCNQKELIIPVFFKFGILAGLLNSELPIKDICSNKIKFSYKSLKLMDSFIYGTDFVLLDMESWGFEFVLDKLSLPRIILKVPVDLNKGELEKFDYKHALSLLENNISYRELLVKINSYLDKNINKSISYMEKYLNNFYFSVSQRDIFNFLYNKYKFKIGGNFSKLVEDFVMKNKNLDKKTLGKKFLEYLKNILKG